MSRVLLLNFSPHGKAARGYQLAADVLQGLPGVSALVERQLGSEPLPLVSGAYATAVTTLDRQAAAVEVSEQQIVELENSDLLVLCTPLHNFTLPAALKLWVDHVVRIQRSFGGDGAGRKVGLLRDRPTFVLVSSGGFIQGEKANQPDFLTPCLTAQLDCVGIRQVRFIYLQGSVRGDEAVRLEMVEARRLFLEGVLAVVG
ncbi:FMN-dependent NADH-azoreductase [Pseudomonas vanderleydeniana]|uniref:FMN dependent NADH:quinone oxidoreductase n=1 Tax=Pseudomonas vanderleydeniana TaxID=2745495 RepID=A0A9E6PMA8_9PSED|nr:NAD(P)H-dependent oxidoreductase [Pseudomonas vanderleydeniana]QXI28862.1 NAD(P)H-dependent oxidoreductase [Pseudomonas vanderleydeniana]